MNRLILLQLIRYIATGTLSVALNTVIIVALTEIAGLPYRISICVCFCTVTVISFALNRYWTFGKRGGNSKSDALRFFFINALYLLICVSLTSFLVEHAGMHYTLAVIAISIVFVPINFLVHRRFSFSLSWPGK